MPRTSHFDSQALAALLRKQHGVISRRQALRCGMTERVLEYRIRGAGPWRVLLPGVYQTHTGQPDDDACDMAALLYAGPLSVLTGMTALRRHGLSGNRPRPGGHAAMQPGYVDVLVPLACRRADARFVRLHRTARLPELLCVAGEVRYVLSPRAVADTVRPMTDLSDVRAVVAEAVQRGRCTIPFLAEELARGPAWGSARLRRALAEVAEGVRSAAEADMRDLIVRARLPLPLFNPRLIVGGEFLAKPDCWWPESGVAGETDSREWHFSPGDWEQTLARHARMSAQGIVVLHFTPSQIRARRSEVADTIRRALARGRQLSQIQTISSKVDLVPAVGRRA
jgi:hypothetical protein